ncbi:Homeobox-like_domain superfamily [Hexamita inflata]|uniref:Homeobox-like domain superfamily n=1 Tax=Hexamita inflata TaxID=28002 RepID=A0AA86R3M2_9EUKA|nr:Homeobox-like domain superfamily [Hexamita inflata]
MQKQIVQALQANYVLLHQIHLQKHINRFMINKQKQQHIRKTDKWSQEEDQLMDIAILIYGENVTAISQYVASKSQAQVYQRLRYLRERRQRKLDKQLL